MPNYQPIELDEGVITLADSRFFAGLVLLYESIQNSYPVPVTCFDAGLSKAQKKWAVKHLPNCTIAPIPQETGIKTVLKQLNGVSENGTNEAMLWICPFLIQNSPYKRVLWLDSDLVVIDKLGALFEFIDDGPVFTTENFNPDATPNHPSLTTLLPLKQQHSIAVPLINAGVSGWDIHRDAQLLEDYIKPVIEACHNEQVRNAISWHDQGSLIWAIQNNGLQHRVLADTEWNRCAKFQHQEVSYNSNNSLNDQLRRAYPDVHIVHWNGYKLENKLFNQIGTESEVLDSVLKRQPGINFSSKQADKTAQIKLISHISSATSHSLIRHFIEYYQQQQIDLFLIILHEVDEYAHLTRQVLTDYGIEPVMCVDDYSAKLKAQRVETIKAEYTSDDDWIVYVDVDEFQVYPMPLKPLLQQCEQSGYQILTGCFVDRLAENGELREIQLQPSIWEQFPYQADITSEITGAWNRKICVAKARVPLDYSGSHHSRYGCHHRSREYRSSNMDPRNYPQNIEIHHFKWDASLNNRLENKLNGKGGDKDAIHGKEFINEYHSLYAHISANRRISVARSKLAEKLTS